MEHDFMNNNALETDTELGNSIEPDNIKIVYNKPHYKKNQKYCNNCGKFGHYFRECKCPITSYGIICFKTKPYPLGEKQKLLSENISYISVRRRNTLSYVEFIRGKYKYTDIQFIMTLFTRMTISERENIKNNKFEILWDNLWTNDKFRKMNKTEYYRAKKKFTDLKMGITINRHHIMLDTILANTSSKYVEPEWNFPKGRRNCYEDDLACAEREFQEESNLLSKYYEIYDTIPPFIEEHIGTNNISYKTVYYLAVCNTNQKLEIDPQNQAQYGEISAIGWFTYKELIHKLIRDYSQEKRTILTNIHNIILEKFNENLD